MISGIRLAGLLDGSSYDALPISLAGFPIDANVWQSIAFTSVTLWLFGWAARKDMWRVWDTNLITASKREPIFTASKPVVSVFRIFRLLMKYFF